MNDEDTTRTRTEHDDGIAIESMTMQLVMPQITSMRNVEDILIISG